MAQEVPDIDAIVCAHDEIEEIGFMDKHTFGSHPDGQYKGNLLYLGNCTSCDSTRAIHVDHYTPVRWHRGTDGKLLFTYHRKRNEV